MMIEMSERETENRININEQGKQIHLVADNFHG